MDELCGGQRNRSREQPGAVPGRILRDTQPFETQNYYRRWLAEGYYAAPEVVNIDDAGAPCSSSAPRVEPRSESLQKRDVKGSGQGVPCGTTISARPLPRVGVARLPLTSHLDGEDGARALTAAGKSGRRDAAARPALPAWYG